MVSVRCRDPGSSRVPGDVQVGARGARPSL